MESSVPFNEFQKLLGDDIVKKETEEPCTPIEYEVNPILFWNYLTYPTLMIPVRQEFPNPLALKHLLCLTAI